LLYSSVVVPLSFIPVNRGFSAPPPHHITSHHTTPHHTTPHHTTPHHTAFSPFLLKEDNNLDGEAITMKVCHAMLCYL
jgi:hypothetical protein